MGWIYGRCSMILRLYFVQKYLFLYFLDFYINIYWPHSHLILDDEMAQDDNTINAKIVQKETHTAETSYKVQLSIY